MLTLAALTLIASPALAQDTAAQAPEDCAMATLSQSLPADGATDVAIDLAPVLLFEGSCGVPAPYTVSLFRTGETDPIRTDVYDFSAFQRAGGTTLLELELGPFDADTSYTLELQGDFGEVEVIAFETGDASVPTLSGNAPGVTIDDAEQTRFDPGFSEVRLSLTVTSAADDPSLSTYIVRSGGVERSIFLASGPTDTTSLVWNVEEPLDEVCVSVVERDGTGTRHGPGDEVCAVLQSYPEPSRPSGCSTTGFAPSVLGMLGGLLALPLLRRR